MIYTYLSLFSDKRRKYLIFNYSLSFCGSYSGPALSILEYDYIHNLLHHHFDFFHHFVTTVAYAN